MALFRCGAGSAIEIVEPGKYLKNGGGTAQSFPFSASTGLYQAFIANVKGYTTMTPTYAGNLYNGLTGIKSDGTYVIISDGNSSAPAAPIDVSVYDYVLVGCATNNTSISWALS